jgi:hypothetical protein
VSKEVKNQRGFQKPFINTNNPVIQVDRTESIPANTNTNDNPGNQYDWGQANSAWDDAQ